MAAFPSLALRCPRVRHMTWLHLSLAKYLGYLYPCLLAPLLPSMYAPKLTRTNLYSCHPPPGASCAAHAYTYVLRPFSPSISVVIALSHCASLCSCSRCCFESDVVIVLSLQQQSSIRGVREGKKEREGRNPGLTGEGGLQWGKYMQAADDGKRREQRSMRLRRRGCNERGGWSAKVWCRSRSSRTRQVQCADVGVPACRLLAASTITAADVRAALHGSQ